MARVLEDAAKRLLGQRGIDIPAGRAARDPETAAAVAGEIGSPVVVKALVPIGRRGKAGAVVFADEPQRAAEAAERLLGTSVHGFVVERVLVEQELSIVRELFLSVSFSAEEKEWRILVSREGGVEVEDRLGAGGQLETLRLGLDASAETVVTPERLGNLDLGLAASSFAGFTRRVTEAARSLDALLLEVNPVALTQDGSLSAAGVIMSVDDYAMFRHDELDVDDVALVDGFGRAATSIEQRLQDELSNLPSTTGTRFIEFPDGDLGLLITGGGGSLLGLDLIDRYGGKPANYVDVSPGASLDQVKAIVRAVMDLPELKAIVAGGAYKSNIRVDYFVEAVADVTRERGLRKPPVPVFARLVGLGEERAKELAATLEDFWCAGEEATINETVQAAVKSCGVGGA